MRDGLAQSPTEREIEGMVRIVFAVLLFLNAAALIVVLAFVLPLPDARQAVDTAKRDLAELVGGGWPVSERRADTGNGEPKIGSETVSGRARVIDGDTIEVAGARIRLHGIDTPERGQHCRAGGKLWPCGAFATRALEDRISGRPVACEGKDRDRYGRIVAVCRLGGEDLNAWMVSQGWALAYRRYSRAYVVEEGSAKKAGLGLWRGEFVPPWDWRRGVRLPASSRDIRRDEPRDPARVTGRGADRAVKGEPGGCRIKGNVSYNRGKRIYHMPGDRDYARTRIDPSRGERWFCSEAEPRAAGWRRAGR